MIEFADENMNITGRKFYSHERMQEPGSFMCTW